MFSPTRTALFVAIAAMGLAANEASAGCRITNGVKFCASWIPGSEICQLDVTGLAPGDGGEGASLSCEVDAVNGSLTGSVFCGPTGGTGDCRHHFNGVGTGHTTNAGNPGHQGDCQEIPNVSLPVD